MIEEIRQTNLLLLAQISKGKAKGKFTPVPRPASAYQRLLAEVRTDSRLTKYNSLVSKLLGDRAKKD